MPHMFRTDSTRASLADQGPTRRDRSNIAVARFLDMPRRIAQERVPTASNVGSRDVTWASQPTPLIPFSRPARERAEPAESIATSRPDNQCLNCSALHGHV